MILQRFRPTGTTNFGDELNTYLWPRLLNPKIQALPGTFYGIGTVLGKSNPVEPCIVFGSGTGYDGTPPENPDRKVYFVRGPRSAADLPGSKYLTDPGILMANYFSKRAPVFECSFMPRWDTVQPTLSRSLEAVGIHLVSPNLDVETVTQEIASSKLLLTEALHGAVVADTLGVPWISIYASRGHEFKWYDWCGSLDMVWNPIDAAEFTLSWARDYTVPQLSARSVHKTRLDAVIAALTKLNTDAEERRL